MSETKYWLRWGAVLPGAILGGILLLLPLHWILYSTLRHFIEPYPELPERMLSPLVTAAGFVWLGTRIAPARQMATAWVLSGLWTVVAVAALVFTLLVGHIGTHQVSVGMAPMGFIGCAIGLIIARNEAKDNAGNTQD